MTRDDAVNDGGLTCVPDLPRAQGLYDPAYEHDACGIGFVAHVHGVHSRDVIDKGLELLNNLSHRSAVAADSCTGDGAGILMQVPHAFFRAVCGSIGIH